MEPSDPAARVHQLYQMDAKQIQSQIPDISDTSMKSEMNRLVYHPMKLTKIQAARYIDRQEMMGIDQVIGLQNIPPDFSIPPSVLSNLIYTPGEPTKCQVLIVVTMYNQGVDEYKTTMEGIADNLMTFVQYGIHPKKIAVCVIIDGVRAFTASLAGNNNKSKKYFQQFYSEDMIKERFKVDNIQNCKMANEQESDEFAHIFMQNVLMDKDKLFPLQLLFTMKQKNKKKLNTHLWFFGGFCNQINPEVVMLIDVGTKPLDKSLFHLYEALKTDPDLAGCCGQIKPSNTDLWKIVTPAQQVEYKINHIFDKALQSVLGYITVLPGAFSAYSWEALQGDPLWQDYFKSLCHPEQMGPFNSNIFLAQDRVLCLALVSKRGCSYTLRYVRNSIAQTDVPDTVTGLMVQRRRWINGSWFALIDTLRNFKNYHRSDQSLCRRIIFTLQMIYYYLTVIFSWLMVGSFYVVFSITVRNQWGDQSQDFGTYIMIVYLILLMVVFTLALAVKPRMVEDVYKFLAVLFGLYMAFAMYLMFVYFLDGIGQDSRDWARYTIMITLILFIVNIVVNRASLIIAKGVIHFLFLTPTYVNVFLIYAICNTHDCSWGNRPDQMSAEQQKRSQDFQSFRGRWTIAWLVTNFLFAYSLDTLDKTETDEQGWYIYVIALTGMFILSLRTAGGMIYNCQEQCCMKKLKKQNKGELRLQFEAAHQTSRTNTVKKSRIMDLSIIQATEPKEEVVDNDSDKYSDSSQESSSLFTEQDLKKFTSDRFKQARLFLNYSVEMMAKETGIPIYTLQQIENDEIQPTEEDITKLILLLQYQL